MRKRALRVLRRSSAALVILSALVTACSWDPSRPFDREAPQVNDALREYDAGDASTAAALLADYLATGGCKEGNIGTPQRVRERSSGSFDLGLALFKIAERFGQRFGEEEVDGGAVDENAKQLRGANVDCALRIVRAVAEDGAQPVPLRARARYLEGNLLFLTAAYKEAVTAYDAALELVPGMGDAGPTTVASDAGRSYAVDSLGRDAAWNRAVALRRIEEKKDAGNDAAPPDGDGGGEQNPDAGGDDTKKDAGKDGGGDKSKDAGGDDAKKDAGGDDAKKDPPKPKDEPEAGAPPPPSRQNQDDRMLDQLENAPTVQQEAARKQGKRRPVQGTADK